MGLGTSDQGILWQGQTVVDMLEGSLSSVEAESGQAYELADDHRAILGCLQNHLMLGGHTPPAAIRSQGHVTSTQLSGKGVSQGSHRGTMAAVSRKAGTGVGARYNPLGQMEVPALLPEDGEEEEEGGGPSFGDRWLVEDVGPPTGKRKRCNPRTPQTERLRRRERGSVQHRPRLLARSGSTVAADTAACSTPSSLLRSSSPALLWNTPTKTTPPNHTPPKTTPTKDTEPKSKNTPPAITAPVLPTSTDSMLRLRVTIENRAYLIPCPRKIDGHDTTVAWLATEAAERYCTHQGVRPVLTLTTADGAHLSPADALADVLQNNEEVRGVVEHKELPPLSERYQMACRNAGMGELVV